MNLSSFNHSILQRIIRDIKRVKSDDVSRERKAITRNILLEILDTLNQITQEEATMHTAFCLTFIAFLRIDEFTYTVRDRKSFDFSQ